MIPIVIGVCEHGGETEDETMNRNHPDGYLEESWRNEETCSHSDFSEKNMSD